MRIKIKAALKMLLMSAFIGVAVSLVVCLYKFCAHHIIHISCIGYSFLRENLWLLPFALAALFGISLFLCRLYSKYKNLKGGGIPNAVLAARGRLRLSPVSDSIGAFATSLLTFLLGVPLGNEGPCVQIGAAISSGVGKVFSKDEETKKALISSGACAGFSAAVGGGFSGMFFCLDEIEHRPKLSVLLCAATSSLVCSALMHIICPILNLKSTIFSAQELPEFSIKNIWIAFLVGGIFAVFSVSILKLYKLLRGFYLKALCKISAQYKIFFVLALSLFVGLISFSFVSTGHEFASELFITSAPIWMLCAVVLIRSFLTFSANINGISGGAFIPLIAISVSLGALISALVSSALGAEFYPLILMLSVCAAISSVMKMPLVAVAVSVELFRCPQYILFVIIVAAFSYLLPALLKVDSISEVSLEEKLAETSH